MKTTIHNFTGTGASQEDACDRATVLAADWLKWNEVQFLHTEYAITTLCTVDSDDMYSFTITIVRKGIN
jgi:hypothetical protein